MLLQNKILLDIGKYFSISMLINIIQFSTLLLLADFLEVEEFGRYKQFTLCLVFVGITSFGFRESVYYEQCRNKLNASEVSERYSFFFFSQVIVSALVFFAGYLVFDIDGILITCFSLLILSNNLASYYIDYFKAEKSFGFANRVSLYAISLNFVLVITFFYTGYIDVYSAIVSLTVASLVRNLITIFQTPVVFSLTLFSKKDFRNFLKKYNHGFPLLIGNLMLLLFDKVDQFFVSSFLGIEDFAIYSFAATLLIIISYVTMAISNVLTPYLFDQRADFDKQAFFYDKAIKGISLIFYVSLPFYFSAIILVEIFYSKYLNSLEALYIMIMTALLNSVTYIMHKNFYFYLGMQKKYMHHNIYFLIVSSLVFYAFYAVYQLEIYEVALIAFSVSLCRFLFCEFSISIKLKTRFYRNALLVIGNIFLVGLLLKYLWAQFSYV